jgi:thymidylate kinase
VFSLAFATDFLHKYETVIKPLKEAKENYVIIEDRCILSTIIYQSLIGKANIEWIREVNKFTKYLPDITLILKLNIDEILKRSTLEKKDFDKFETKRHLEDEVIIYNNLTPELVKEFKIQYIDANKDPERISKECSDIIQKEINRRTETEKFFKI